MSLLHTKEQDAFKCYNPDCIGGYTGYIDNDGSLCMIPCETCKAVGAPRGMSATEMMQKIADRSLCKRN